MLKAKERQPGQLIYWITGPVGCGRRVSYRGVLLQFGEKRAKIAILKRDDNNALVRVVRFVAPFWVSPRANRQDGDELLTLD